MHSDPIARPSRMYRIESTLRTKIEALERTLHRLELEHRVLWELVRDATKMTEKDLEQRVRQIDMRDGIEDGKVTAVPLRCPNCRRVSSSKHWKCLYCGEEFEKYSY